LWVGAASAAPDAGDAVRVRFAPQVTHAGGGAVEVSIAGGSIREMRSAFSAGQSVRVLDFAMPGGRAVSLHLSPVRMTPPRSTARVMGASGERRIRTSAIALAGAVSGAPGSFAFIGLTRNRVEGFVSLPGETFIISSGPGGGVDPRTGGMRAMISKTGAFASAGVIDCLSIARAQARGSGEGDALERRGGAGQPGDGASVRIADLFVEVNHQVRALFDNAEDAADYSVLLLSAVSSIYRRDLGVEIRIPDGYLRVWETRPPWGTNYTDFQCYWRGDDNPLRDLPRAAVHQLKIEGGGVATVGGLCSARGGFGQSGIVGHFPYPAEHTHADNWDLYLVAHELGHNFGSIHTFEYDPPIACEDGSGPDRGTIMSYCNNGCGMDCVGMRFHPRVQGVIRRFIDRVGCFEVAPIETGDYDHDGVLADADLDAARMCVDLGFAAAGCLETFDVYPLDGRLTECDYEWLARRLDPDRPIVDCNDNMIDDCAEIVAGDAADCNGNGVPDVCDVAPGGSGDCNDNGVPDECEDCNENRRADACDIAEGVSEDCTGNGVPDECEPDCNENLVPDSCDILAGFSEDANDNEMPDECEGDAVRRVPGEYPTIQAAIDASIDGNTVLVSDGVYGGDGNTGIRLRGLSITVRSRGGAGRCVIDASGAEAGFVFSAGDGPSARIEGFTVIGGGSAVLSTGGSPTIADCVLTGSVGHAVSCMGVGGPRLENCTIIRSGGFGVRAAGDCAPEVRSSIVRANTAGSIAHETGVPTVRFSNMEGGWDGEGNIDTDPLFVDFDGGDVRLTGESPCIDAGDPGREAVEGESDYDGEPRVFRYRTDMGADEFHDCNTNRVADLADIALGTSDDGNENGVPDECEAACQVNRRCTMTTRERCESIGCERFPEWLCLGDVNGDGRINPSDAALVEVFFGVQTSEALCNYDIDCDGQINPVDSGLVQMLFGACPPPPETCHVGLWLDGEICNPDPCD
jgi:hypothetical protein